MALQLPNGLAFVVFHLALTAVGAVTAIVPIVYRERELQAMLALTEAKGLVVPRAYGNDDFLPMADALSREVPGLTHVFLVGGDPQTIPAGAIGYEAFMDHPWEREGDTAALAALRRSRTTSRCSASPRGPPGR